MGRLKIHLAIGAALAVVIGFSMAGRLFSAYAVGSGSSTIQGNLSSEGDLLVAAVLNSCNPIVTGDRPGEGGTTHAMAYDGDLATFFNSTYSDWQFIQIDFNCVGTLNSFRRYMTRDGSDVEGNRGPQGEGFSYSLDGTNWTDVMGTTTNGWEDYVNYAPHAWHSLNYGWSAWLNLNKPVQARYVRFQWDDDFDAVNKIEVIFTEDAPTPTPIQTCIGAVHEGEPGKIGVPLPDVAVGLYGSNNPGEQGTTLDETVTDAEGRYTLITEEVYEFYHVVQTPPPGYVASGALTEVGEVVSLNWIRYALQDVGSCGLDNFLNQKGESEPPASETGIHVRFDRATYRPQDDCLRVTVEHAAANRDPEQVETVAVDVVSAYPEPLASGDQEHLVLVETFANSGVFVTEHCVPLQMAMAEHNDGLLQVNPGDLISVIYQDAANPTQPQSLDELGLAADFALITGGRASDAFTFEIIPEILPPGLSHSPGATPLESPRPLALAVDPQGMPQLFGEDQVVFLPDSEADLLRFLKARNGRVVETIPFQEEDGPKTYYLIRLDPLQVDPNELPYLMDLAEHKGHVTFSSAAAAGLATLIMQEQLGGRFVIHNPVAWYLNGPRTAEATSADGITSKNGLAQTWMDNPAVRLREGMVYLDLIDRNQAGAVNVAVIDGGYALNPDLAVTVQGDCSQPDCTGSALGPNPVSPFCADVGGPGCDWHGTGVASIIGAVGDNQFGAVGVAGLGRDIQGRTGQLGVANLMLYSMNFPYMTTLARGVHTATEQGAEIITISSGFPCKPLLGVNICSGTTRTLVAAACGILRFLIPSPLLTLLIDLPCGSLLAIFNISGVADEDVLQAALTRAVSRGVVVVASGPEHITLPVLGDMGPFDALDVQMMPCVHRDVICVGWLQGPKAAEPTPHAKNPFGSAIGIWAPGSELQTTPNPASNGQIDTFGGTSAAAPFIAGVVALMRAADPALSPVAIRNILQVTSRVFTAPPPNCVRKPDGSGQCVGIVDVLAAVQSAAGVSLSCTGWDDPFSGVTLHNPHRFPSIPPQVGSEISVTGNLAIHGLTTPLVVGGQPQPPVADIDWYSFQVPAVGNTASTEVEIELLVGDHNVGRLQMGLFRDSENNPVRRDARVFDNRIVLRPNPLFAHLTYQLRVTAEPPVAINDNCYDGVVVRVIGTGPEGDRYEPNNTPADAVAPLEQWVHERFHDPTILEHGVVPPVVPGVNGWMSSNQWVLRVPDLNLHSQDDKDYFRIPLPDPASLAWTGYPDIDPDPGVIEPMLECGESSRRSFESGETDHLYFHGALTVWINRSDPSGAEQIILNGNPGRGLTVPLPCPRSELNLEEVLLGYGERTGLRDQVVPYDMTLYYGVSIFRLPSAIPSIWGRSTLGGLPCPGGFFPQCDPRVEIVAMDLPHPLIPVDEPGCGPVDCRSAVLFEWMAAGQFVVDFETADELTFVLYDLQGEHIADARPFDPPATVQDGQAAGAAPRLLHLSTPLEPGLYVLAADGPAGEFTMRFEPQEIPEERLPTGPSYRLYLPGVER